jgi:hypothetical protein
MEKLRFQTVLDGERVYGNPKYAYDETVEQIDDIKCLINWSLDPDIRNWGISHFRPQFDSFAYTAELESLEDFERTGSVEVKGDSLEDWTLEVNFIEWNHPSDLAPKNISIDFHTKTAVINIK